MSSLLANEKAVIPLIKYLKATEVGGREGAREREAEWEKKTTEQVKPCWDRLRRENPKVAV